MNTNMNDPSFRINSNDELKMHEIHGWTRKLPVWNFVTFIKWLLWRLMGDEQFYRNGWRTTRFESWSLVAAAAAAAAAAGAVMVRECAQKRKRLKSVLFQSKLCPTKHAFKWLSAPISMFFSNGILHIIFFSIFGLMGLKLLLYDWPTDRCQFRKTSSSSRSYKCGYNGEYLSLSVDFLFNAMKMKWTCVYAAWFASPILWFSHPIRYEID